MKFSQLIIILVIAISTNVYANEACLQKAVSQLDINDCASSDAKAADQELNRVYKEIQKKYNDDAVFLNKLKLAQLAWIKFRDAQINMMFPHSDEANYYGSIFPSCYLGEMTSLTNERVKTLKRWLAGHVEGDGCSGSIR